LGGERHAGNGDKAAEHVSNAGGCERVCSGRLQGGKREDGELGVALRKDEADRDRRADSLPGLRQGDAGSGGGVGVEGIRSGDVDF